jgi:hypothetical protein
MSYKKSPNKILESNPLDGGSLSSVVTKTDNLGSAVLIKKAEIDGIVNLLRSIEYVFINHDSSAI